MASSSSLPARNAAFPAVPQKSLPKSVYNPRRHVGVHAERVSDVSSTEYPGHYPGEDHSWNLEEFKKVSDPVTVRLGFYSAKKTWKNLRVRVQRLSQRSIEFDLIGVDASIANAFRRILIAEVRMVLSTEGLGR